MKKTIVKVIVNDQHPRKIELDDQTPTASFYVEHEPFAKKCDAGLSEKERKIAVMMRSACALFDTALQTAIDLEEIDPDAAAELWDAFTLSIPEEQAEE